MLDVPGSNPGVPTNYNRLPITIAYQLKAPPQPAFQQKSKFHFLKRSGIDVPSQKDKTPAGKGL